MSASLKAAVRRLQRTSLGSPRLIIVIPLLDPSDVAGSITPMPSGCGFVLAVPWDSASDPMAGLSIEQQALIRPDDQIIAVCYDAPDEESP